MNIHFDPTGTPAGLQHCLQQAALPNDVTGLLVLACDGNDFKPNAIDPVLFGSPLPLAGGIFPNIIHDGRLLDQGTLVIGLKGVVAVETICGLNNPGLDYESMLNQKVEDSSQVKTLVLFVDCFATRVSAFTDSLFNVFGLDFNYIGGGAGSLSALRKPCILTNRGMAMDCAVLAFLSIPSGVGVCHGYKETAGPFQVTDAGNNLIRTIEWQPAFDFYGEMLLEIDGTTIDRNDFYTTSQHYPFGIARLDGTQIVRDAFQALPGGELVCIGEVQEGAFVSILTTSERQLLAAAAEALRLGLENLPAEATGELCLFVDCISQAITLGTSYQQVIHRVSTTDIPMVGICSIGEIANCGTEYLDFYNKTAVIAVLGR